MKITRIPAVIIGLVVRVFANGQGDLGSIPGHVIPNSLKMVLDAALQYKVRNKGKVEQSGKSVALSPTIRCRSYGKVILLFALDYGHQLT